MAVIAALAQGMLVLPASDAAAQAVLPEHGCEFIRCGAADADGPPAQPEPFVLRGNVISIDDPTVNRHIAARLFPIMRKFPTLESCVTNAHPERTLLTDAKMNWWRIKSASEAGVCIFRLANAMRDPQRLAEWLAKNGFEHAASRRGDQVGSMIYEDKNNAREDVTIVTSLWTFSESGTLYGSIFMRIIMKVVMRGISVHVVFDRSGNVLYAEVSEDSKLIK